VSPGEYTPVEFLILRRTGPSRAYSSGVQHPSLSRRDLIRHAAAAGLALAFPLPLAACQSSSSDPDRERLASWTRKLRSESLARAELSLGSSVGRVGELAAGTPYQPYTLDAYLRAGNSSSTEPLTLSLTRFDCVTLVETCLAVSRVARARGIPTWEGFGREIERMRYRDGIRRSYSSRLHYFSEWIADGARRGLLQDLGPELGGALDSRPLRFMTEHRDKYPALQDEEVFHEMHAIELELDSRPRRVVPTKRIPEVVGKIETGDVLAFATEIPGLDVTHSALAYRDKSGTLRVLHAPLSGGVVEVTRTTLPEYVSAIRRSTGILVARPLPA
jgi:Protein of unknown function (DUF1460)